MPDYPASGTSPIDSIRLVAQLTYDESTQSFQATSLPGHLLHLVLSGEVEQTCNGRQQHLTPGCVVWYHEDEWVEGRVIRAPWIYYTVNFAAPTLAPPDFDARLLTDQLHLQNTFAALHDNWQRAPSRERDFHCQAHLLKLLAAINPRINQPSSVTPHGRLWWEVETWARQHIDRAVTLGELCAQFHRSPQHSRASLRRSGRPHTDEATQANPSEPSARPRPSLRTHHVGNRLACRLRARPRIFPRLPQSLSTPTQP